MNRRPIRSLLMTVVQESDLDLALKALEDLGVSAVYLTSMGGFLGRRNATFLIGLPEGAEEQAVEALKKVCRQRVEYLALPMEGSPMPLPAPIPVTVGGATVFTLPVERFEEF
ncbi:MAG: cyclic-di-AMP receptor [Anaerolineales bacterium]|nr:cyclic-di-AMP receptor [Anaerolineales bacterium]